MAEFFGYSNAKVGTRTEHGKVVKCPECGRKGALRTYTDGSGQIVHAGYIQAGFRHIEGSCFFQNLKQAGIK